MSDLLFNGKYFAVLEPETHKQKIKNPLNSKQFKGFFILEA
jgi:hypothetical protein